jgi:hypothetical protein
VPGRWLIGLAFALYLIAGALALWASISRKYLAVIASALNHMLTGPWTDSEVTASNITGVLNTQAVGSLRVGNDTKAKLGLGRVRANSGGGGPEQRCDLRPELQILTQHSATSRPGSASIRTSFGFRG